MCGIAGYIGDFEKNGKFLFSMLERLEYRGYDSAGISYILGKDVIVRKDKGRIKNLISKVEPENIKFKCGIAHTRWATHGIPSKKNAHPHSDCENNFSIIHNGIIEDHAQLKRDLLEKGHKFLSDTDTEVIVHLIEEYYKLEKDFERAFLRTLRDLKGGYAICAISSNEPDKILVARNESPLIIGLGNNENFIASDIPAILPNTKKIIILDDFEYGIVTKSSVTIKKIDTIEEVKKEIQEVDWNIDEAEKGGYTHFMIKEIFEEPIAVKNALRSLKDIDSIAKKIAKKEKIYWVACGTAWHATLVGKYILEKFGIASEAVIGSEFRYSTESVIDENCHIISVSQSGETTDTIASIKEARARGAKITSIVNVVGSTLTRNSDDVIYIHAGPEIAVASTKAYIGQVTAIILLSIHIAREREKIDNFELNEMLIDLEKVPEKIGEILNNEDKIKKLAEKFYSNEIFFYIGRRLGYPTALEGALKIKEVSYVHAEAYPAGEMKHGPIALLEEGVPVIAIMPENELSEKMDSNIEEAKARNASVIKISEKEDGEIIVPSIRPILSPLIYIVPLHLFAYYISILRGIDPDKPRNLAKSVTVE